MKKILFITLLFCGLLVGCDQQNRLSQTDMNNENSQNNKANLDHTKIKIKKYKNNQKINNDNLQKYHYHIPKSYYSNKNFVKNGNLKRKNQFAFDQFGTKQQLKNIRKLNQIVKVGNVRYQFTSIRLFKNKASDSKAINIVKQVFNTNKIKPNYYTIQLKFNVINNHKQNAYLNGFQFIKINNNQFLTSNYQLSDESAGQILKPSQSKSMFTMGLISGKNYYNFNKIQLKINGIYNSNGSIIDHLSHEINLKF